MIISLHVKNLALIQEIEIEFGQGLNILTGETGAGKSILLGAVNIALGMKNFREMVAEGTEYAFVELVFSSDQETARERLDQADIPWNEGELIISRKYTKGRSISRVNGETVPVSFVRDLASLLIDIHGQHEHQSLLYATKHLEILDKYAGEELETWKQLCAEQYHAYTAARRKLVKAREDAGGRTKEADFLQFEISEIDAAGLREGEDDELEAAYRKMANGQKIMEALGEVSALTGENAAEGASDQIGHAVRLLTGLGDTDENLKSLTSSLLDMESLINDFNRELSAYIQDFHFDEQQLLEMQQRLDLINHLKAKYGKNIRDILKYRDEKAARLEILADYEGYLQELKGDFEKNYRAILRTSREITRIRHDCAQTLAEKIRQALVDLNFLDVQFEIVFSSLEKPCEKGMDSACFMISTNPGMPLRPIQQVASGGELSRIMLAIKAVMAEQDAIDTLIFDEIDTGISGRTAQKVSEKMTVIARRHQVICITHLAQIAAMADVHYLIEKHTMQGKTITNIVRLSQEEIIPELARILGGVEITQAVLDNAREMKILADQIKKL